MPDNLIKIKSNAVIDVESKLQADKRELKSGGASDHAGPEIDERSINSPPTSEPSDLISRENEHDEPPSRQVNGEQSECSPAVEAGSPSLQQLENQVVTEVDPSPARRSVASLRPSDAERLDEVFARLRRIAELRSLALDARSLAKEKGAHLRIIHSRLIKETQKLVQNLKARASAPVQNECGSTSLENLEDWEDLFDELDGLMKDGDVAGQEFDKEVKNSIDLDWVLCELEKDVYISHNGENAPPSTTAAIAKRISSAQGIVPGNDNSALHVESTFGADDPTIAVFEAHESQSPVQDYSMFYSDYDGDEGPPLLAFADGDEDFPQADDYVSVQETNSDLYAPGAPHEGGGNQFDGVLSGSQFIDVDVTKSMTESPESTFPMKLLKQSSFTDDELEEFTEWLLAETPWVVGITQKRDQLLAAVSNVNFLRAWIWHSLGSLCTGHLPLPKRSDERKLAISYTGDFFKQWFRNPFVAADVRPPDPQSEEVGDREVEQAQMRSVGEPSVLDIQEHPSSIDERPPSPPPSDQAAEPDRSCLAIPSPPQTNLRLTPPTERRRSSISGALMHVQLANMVTNVPEAASISWIRPASIS